MTTPESTPEAMTVVRPPAQIQHARGLLAAVVEQRAEQLGHTAHLLVLRAFDDLEDAAHHVWPPPPAAKKIVNPTTTLAEARRSLRAVAADPDLYGHWVDWLRVALAAHHLNHALDEIGEQR